MSDEHLLVSSHEGVLTLTLNRPEQRNAISPAMLEAMSLQLQAASRDSAVRAVVLTATGDKAFCAGADLQSGQSFRFDYSKTRLPMADLMRVARRLDVPLVGRINGTCMAGGMGLLAICDLVVAADHALFGLPEVKVGVYPMQVLAVLQNLIPRRHLLQLCLTGDPINAAKALEIGLVNVVVASWELDIALSALLASLLARSPTALRRGKYATYAIESMSFEDAMHFMEGQIGLLAATEDAAEGQRAFREKRQPQWTGR